MKSKKAQTLFEKLLPLFFVAFIAMAFAVGMLWQKVQYLEKGTSSVQDSSGQVAQTVSSIDIASLKTYAKELKLDENKFNSCLDEGKYAQEISNEMNYGSSLGVTGTPGFIANGYLISGALPYQSFKTILDFILKGGDMAKPPAEIQAFIDSKILFTKKVTVDTAKAPSKGSASAPIKMVEFSDFECPYCHSFFSQTMPSLIKDYVDTGKVQFFYMHFPLSFHAHAQKAAEAAECANEQGKFWEMHDKMFGAQS